MRQKFPGDRSNPAIKNRLLSSLIRHLPGAWVYPKHYELISLYRLRYRMALEEKKFVTSIIYLTRIIDLNPHTLETMQLKAYINQNITSVLTNVIGRYNT